MPNQSIEKGRDVIEKERDVIGKERDVIEKDGNGKQYMVLKCPHCEEDVLLYLDEINCTIYRHAYYKKDMKQISPHTKKEECDRLAKEDLIFGCGKPFRIKKNGEKYEIEICGYI